MKLDIEKLFIERKSLYGYKNGSNRNGLIEGIKLVREKDKIENDKIICFEIKWNEEVIYIPVGDIERGIYKLTDKETYNEE